MREITKYKDQWQIKKISWVVIGNNLVQMAGSIWEADHIFFLNFTSLTHTKHQGGTKQVWIQEPRMSDS